ncbi:hypothetical protein HDU98_005129, partial [Podochytrium sp. JEL0797]
SRMPIIFCLPVALFSLAQASTTQHARRQDPPSATDDPCTASGTYLCKANNLYQCSYEADLTLGYRLLWNCGNDACTISPTFSGCSSGSTTTTSQATNAQLARRQDTPPATDEPCTVFYQCSYEADFTLGYRFLWNCGSDVCTVSPAFTGCAPGSTTTTTSLSTSPSTSSTTSATTATASTVTSAVTTTTSTGPICQFGAWRCVGATLEQCGFVDRGVLDLSQVGALGGMSIMD